MKPVIGITSPVSNELKEGDQVVPIAQLGAQYVRAVRDAGGLPVVFPASFEMGAAPADVLERLDGILFSGGSPLSERRFLSSKDRSLRETDPERYDYEVDMVRQAYRRRLPMMGICRGHQTIVEALGGRVEAIGKLLSEESVEHRQTSPRVEPAHGLKTVDHTPLRSILGSHCQVNSLHRQAVSKIPEEISAAAHSPDGLIEAVVGKDAFILGLQFHPEWLYGRFPEFLELFKLLVHQAKTIE